MYDFIVCRVTEDDIRQIEKATIGQSSNPEWLKYRKDRLTASKFGEFCKMRPTTSVTKKVFQLRYGKPIYSPHMEHGQRMEDTARSAFEAKIGKTVRECGLFIDFNSPYLAASPGITVQNDVV